LPSAGTGINSKMLLATFVCFFFFCFEFIHGIFYGMADVFEAFAFDLLVYPVEEVFVYGD
jgi:hypothetical protein